MDLSAQHHMICLSYLIIPSSCVSTCVNFCKAAAFRIREQCLADKYVFIPNKLDQLRSLRLADVISFLWLSRLPQMLVKNRKHPGLDNQKLKYLLSGYRPLTQRYLYFLMLFYPTAESKPQCLCAGCTEYARTRTEGPKRSCKVLGLCRPLLITNGDPV